MGGGCFARVWTLYLKLILREVPPFLASMHGDSGGTALPERGLASDPRSGKALNLRPHCDQNLAAQGMAKSQLRPRTNRKMGSEAASVPDYVTWSSSVPVASKALAE